MPGRFRLGVGSGEALNEHILGDRWPPTDTRHEMLEEAVSIMRELFTGEEVTHHGRHYTVENARLFSLPDEPVEILIAVGGAKAFELANRIGDGMVTHKPDSDQVQRLQDGGSGSRVVVGELAVSWARDEDTAAANALTAWPNAALPGELSQELPHPKHFEQAAQILTPDDLAESVVCGPDPQRHIDAITEYAEAGFTHVAVHQASDEMDGFWEFYADEVIPNL